MKDPFVTEVRKYRMVHTKKFDYNIHAICDDLRKYQEKLNKTLDRACPKFAKFELKKIVSMGAIKLEIGTTLGSISGSHFSGNFVNNYCFSSCTEIPLPETVL